jgi:predicted ester cyclase
MGDDVTSIAARFLESQDELRSGPVDELCSSTYTAHLGGHPPMDLAGHKAFAAAFYAGFPDLRHRIEQVVADGPAVAIRFRLTGTNTGEFLGAASTGRAIDVGAIALFDVRDGHVHELHGQFDELGVLQQLGLLPQPAPTVP